MFGLISLSQVGQLHTKFIIIFFHSNSLITIIKDNRQDENLLLFNIFMMINESYYNT